VVIAELGVIVQDGAVLTMGRRFLGPLEGASASVLRRGDTGEVAVVVTLPGCEQHEQAVPLGTREQIRCAHVAVARFNTLASVAEAAPPAGMPAWPPSADPPSP
jgi:hypothetical protein